MTRQNEALIQSAKNRQLQYLMANGYTKEEALREISRQEATLSTRTIFERPTEMLHY